MNREVAMADRLVIRAVFTGAATAAVVAAFTAPASASAAQTGARPGVTSLSVASGPKQGGTVLRIRGRNFDGTDKVTIGGSKAVLGYVKPTWLEVWTPAHVVGQVQVRVHSDAGTSAASQASSYRYIAPTARHGLPAGTAFVPPKTTEGGEITPSCPTADFCVAADGFGNVSYFDGTTWSGATRIDDIPVTLSCPTTSFCAAVDKKGREVRYDGATWTAPTSIGTFKPESLSCASPTLCLIITQQHEYLYYNGSAWTAPAAVPNVPDGLVATEGSCGGSRCVVPTNTVGSTPAELLTFDGSTWTDIGHYLGPNGSGESPSIFHISCPTSSFCAIADDQLQVSFLDGTTITGTSVRGAYTATPVALTCSSDAFCVYMEQDPNEDDNTFVDVYDGTDWSLAKGWEYDDGSTYLNVSCGADQTCFIGAFSSVTAYQHGLNGSTPVLAPLSVKQVSCGSTTMCIATDQNGRAAVERNGTWGPTRTLSHQGKQVGSHVSCASTSFCAFSNGARVRFYRNGTWRSDPLVDTHPLSQVSCGSAHLCAALDIFDRAIIYNGKRWSKPHQVAGSKRFFVGLSCAGTGICAALDSQGGAVVYRDGHWSRRHKEFNDPSASVAGTHGDVSCGGRNLCVITDDALEAVRVYDGHHWHSPRAITYLPGKAPAPRLVGVWCTSGSFCLAQDQAKAVYAYNGSTWSERHVKQRFVLTCLSSRECLTR
jgi:hypothetical protein